jgi:hypothetical protein
MESKPRGWAADYAAWFDLVSVAERYGLRPPYPDQTFDLLASLVDPADRSVRVAGSGNWLAHSRDAWNESMPWTGRPRCWPGAGPWTVVMLQTLGGC